MMTGGKRTAGARKIAGAVIVTMVGILAGLAMAPSDARPIAVILKARICECCEKWSEHLSEAGFIVQAREVEDSTAHMRARESLGVGEDLAACHTALVGSYVIEGHVPAAAIKRLLSENPVGVAGLAVPGMPLGSPGMEFGDADKTDESYEVQALHHDGTVTTFSYETRR